MDPQERGETDLVEMEILTGDAEPVKQNTRRMPFAVRCEVARQLKAMQESGFTQPSRSPWSSPVIMVRKCDVTHRFCVDYHKLNIVTKTDTFQLPQIDVRYKSNAGSHSSSSALASTRTHKLFRKCKRKFRVQVLSTLRANRLD